MDHEALPLRGEDSEAIDRLISRLGDFLYAGYAQHIERKAPPDTIFSAWEVAQISTALHGLNLPGRRSLDVPLVVRFLQSKKSLDCNCWREREGESSAPPHIGATAWAIFAKARLGVAAEQGEIRFLLDQQLPRYNSWAMFPCSQPDSGSTYATSFVVLALSEQARRGLLREPLASEATDAARSGLSWLRANRSDGSAMWKSYPRQDWDDNLSRSNSALATHVLAQLESDATDEYRAAWMESLGARRPSASEFDTFNADVCRGENIKRESVRYLILPWTLIATVDSYETGSLLERRRALSLLQSVTADADPIMSEVKQEYFVASELLIALRHLREKYLSAGLPSQEGQVLDSRP